MSLLSTVPRVSTVRRRRRERVREQRELRNRDRDSARLAELHGIAGLLTDARAVIDHGWIQDGWFAYDDPAGMTRTVTAYHLRQAEGQHVVGACLVGAIVHAAGGPAQARSQVVQRTIDLTWHTLYRRADETVRWCPSPAERAGHLRDLTRWNDRRGRDADEVTDLFGRAEGLARTEIERIHRGELVGGAPTPA